MAGEWHYSKGGQQHGPVAASDLKAMAKSGDLTPTDMVWKEGMADWKPAGSLKGLFTSNSESKSPPPLPKPQPSAPREDHSQKKVTGQPQLLYDKAKPVLQRLWQRKIALFGVAFLIMTPIYFSLMENVVQYYHGLMFVFCSMLLLAIELGLLIGFLVSLGRYWIPKMKAGIEKSQKEFRALQRRQCLQRKWQSVNGNSPAIQFTEDGAMIRFDGFAARYTLVGEEPNEVIIIHIDDTNKVELKVLSLSRDEMMLSGEGGNCHYRLGVSITDAESQRRADAAMEQLKTVGKAALITVGAVGAVAVIGVGIAVLGVAAGVGAAAGASGGGGTSGGGGEGSLAGASGSSPSAPQIKETVCSSCRGKGWQNMGTTNERRCPTCGGQGVERRSS